MEYAKPELTLLTDAIETVHAETLKRAVPIDNSHQSATGAYESDE